MSWMLVGNLPQRIINYVARFNLLNLATNSSVHASVKMKGSQISGLVTIAEGCKLSNVKFEIGSRLSVGRHTSFNGPNTDIYAAVNEVSIGSFCSIARNVSIQEYNHHHNRLTTYNIFKNIFLTNQELDYDSKGPIIIENDVWIGSHCVITSGAHISSGAVIATNSVVTGYIPPYAIVGGTPAKVIKYRFEPEAIEQLLQLKWWDWPIERIIANKSIFSSSINQFLLDKIKAL
jgi:virginiamycin A acetyltransferase